MPKNKCELIGRPLKELEAESKALGNQVILNSSPDPVEYSKCVLGSNAFGILGCMTCGTKLDIEERVMQVVVGME